MDRIRTFFPKTGQVSLLPLVTSLWIWLNMNQYPWIQCLIQMKFGDIHFNWNDLYDLQRKAEGFCFCLICYQLHWKVHDVSTLGTFLGAHSVSTLSLVLWMRLWNILKYPWKCLNKFFWLWQSTEYAWSVWQIFEDASGCKCIRVLNMTRIYMQGLHTVLYMSAYDSICLNNTWICLDMPQ